MAAFKFIQLHRYSKIIYDWINKCQHSRLNLKFEFLILVKLNIFFLIIHLFKEVKFVNLKRLGNILDCLIIKWPGLDTQLLTI